MYMEILKQCFKCGRSFTRSQSEQCPHKFRDTITQFIHEGKWKEVEEETRKRYEQEG